MFRLFIVLFACRLAIAFNSLNAELINANEMRKYFHFSNFTQRNLKLRHLKDECDTNSMQKIQKFLTDDICLPRSTLVELKDPDPNIIQILPQHVFLHRCVGGHTSKTHGCIPWKTKLINIPAILITANMEQYCSMVKMEDHVACKIGCKITKRNCNSKQIFNKNTCRCECADQNEKRECGQSGKMWIEVTCSCECVPSTKFDCSTGYYFDQHLCRCLPLATVDSSNNMRQYISALIKTSKKTKIDV